MAALNKQNCEEHPRSNSAQNSNVPRSQEDYITQVSEEIEGGVTKRLSKEFSRTENRIIGALARLDDFLINPILQGHSGTTPEPSRNALSTSQGTNEKMNQEEIRNGPDMVTGGSEEVRNGHDMVTGVQKESLCGHDMVAGATEQSRNCHDMTGIYEEVTYCSPSTFSGKQKKPL